MISYCCGSQKSGSLFLMLNVVANLKNSLITVRTFLAQIKSSTYNPQN